MRALRSEGAIAEAHHRCAACSQAVEYGAPSDPAWVVFQSLVSSEAGARPECDARHSRKPRHVQNLREIHPAESRLNDLRLVR
jgi:hypothetical protein